MRKEDVINTAQQYYALKQANNKGLALRRYVHGIINAENLGIAEPSPDFMALAREVAKAYKLFLQAGQLRSESNYHEADKLIAERLGTQLFASPCRENTPAAQDDTEDLAEGINIKLGEFIREYNEKILSQHNIKEATGTLKDLNLFKNFVGDVRLNKIPLDRAKQFCAQMKKVPTNWLKIEEYKHIPFEKLDTLKLASDKLLASRTAYKRVGAISAAFNWAMKQGYRVNQLLPKVIQGEKLAGAVAVRNKRDAFTAEDIKKMFGHDGYGKDEFDRSFQFWLPLLGLYTGARLTELCQLNPQTDITQTGSGIWFLDINEDDGKKVKTEAGVRKIPIHPKLIEIGFLDYIEKRKAEGETLLFPELRNNRKDGNIYNRASAWFNRTFKKSIGIVSVRRKELRNQEKKDFHSFRHHFVSYCKINDIAIDKVQECVGHELKIGVTATYSGAYTQDNIYNDVILKLNFDTEYDLNLSRLRGSKYARG